MMHGNPGVIVVDAASEVAGPGFAAAAHQIFASLVRSGAALGWLDPPLAEVAALLQSVARASAAGNAALRAAYAALPATAAGTGAGAAGAVAGTPPPGQLIGLGYWTRYERPTHRLSIASDWGQPCLSYLLCIRPDADAQASLSAVQDAVAGPEPSLLRIPPGALHISIAWLIPVHQEFSQPKEELWAQHGPGWRTAIAAALRSHPPFRLRLRHLVATDAGVILVAGAPNQVTALRRRLAGPLALPGRQLSRGEFVHTTLFRYGGPLADPAGLLRRVTGTPVDVQLTVHEMLLVRERIFPSLGCQAVHNFILAQAPSHAIATAQSDDGFVSGTGADGDPERLGSPHA